MTNLDSILKSCHFAGGYAVFPPPFVEKTIFTPKASAKISQLCLESLFLSYFVLPIYFFILLPTPHCLDYSETKVAQACPTLCDTMDYSLSGFWIHGISSQEYWSGLPFPSPVDLPDPGIKPGSPALQADALRSEPPEKPICRVHHVKCQAG